MIFVELTEQILATKTGARVISSAFSVSSDRPGRDRHVTGDAFYALEYAVELATKLRDYITICPGTGTEGYEIKTPTGKPAIYARKSLPRNIRILATIVPFALDLRTEKTSKDRPCPKCGTYCHGDCEGN